MTATIIPFPGSRRQHEARRWLATVQNFNFDMPMRHPPRVPGHIVHSVAGVLADYAAAGKWPSHAEISRAVIFKRPSNLGEAEHVYWALRALKEAGFLHIDRHAGPGRRNGYTLLASRYGPVSA